MEEMKGGRKGRRKGNGRKWLDRWNGKENVIIFIKSNHGEDIKLKTP